MRISELLSTSPPSATDAKVNDTKAWHGASVREDFLKLKPKLKPGATDKSLRDVVTPVGRQKSKRKSEPKTSG